jgi:hypothetical protein
MTAALESPPSASLTDLGDPVHRDLQRGDHRALIPLALRGVRYRPSNPNALLTRNLLVYGLGGVVAPFIGIKLIDFLLVQFIPGMS